MSQGNRKEGVCLKTEVCFTKNLAHVQQYKLGKHSKNATCDDFWETVF